MLPIDHASTAMSKQWTLHLALLRLRLDGHSPLSQAAVPSRQVCEDCACDESGSMGTCLAGLGCPGAQPSSSWGSAAAAACPAILASCFSAAAEMGVIQMTSC